MVCMKFFHANSLLIAVDTGPRIDFYWSIAVLLDFNLGGQMFYTETIFTGRRTPFISV